MKAPRHAALPHQGSACQAAEVTIVTAVRMRE
jgi:hypothetical protein